MLEATELKTYFKSKTQAGFFKKPFTVKAVNGVSVKLELGKTLGLVGESGCGKTTLGRTLVGLIEPIAGKIIYKGKDISFFDDTELKIFRRHVQMVFQDPFGSLNPRMKIFSIISEGPFIHKISYGAALRDKAERLMEMVGLEPEYLDRYPHEFSGGQRQRLNIARALALEPEFLICDEPVSSLDVSIQAQIIKLLQKLQERLGFGCLFISHDLRVIKHISDEVAVMFAGKIVEHAKTQELYENPLHPYTKILLSSIPKFQIDEKTGDWQCLTDFFTRESFSMKETEKILGCGFYPECPDRTDKCERIVPDLIDTGPGHYIACLRVTG